MGNYHKVALPLLGLIFIGLVKAQLSPRILFLGANTFRAGTNYDATVTSLSGETLSVTVSILNNKTRQVISTQQATVTPGAQVSFSLLIPGIVRDSTGKFVVRVEEGTSYRNETAINFREKNRSLFIVTDKSIYKPGATVKFRAFAVSVDLLPKNDPITVEIFDPKGNKLKQWLNQNGQSGVVSGELELSTLTSLGTWKIKATSMNHEGTETFQVEEYTLPKFEVVLSLNPTFIVSSHDAPMRMTAKVTANYNIGTPVDGDLTLEVKGERTSSRINVISITRKISGVQNVEITFPAGTFSKCVLCAMIAEASVTDSLTGETRKTAMKFQTWLNLEKLEFLPSADYIKPGLMNRFKLKLTQQDGLPLLKIGKQVVVTVTETSSDYPSSRSSTRKEVYRFDLPDSGILTIEHQTAENVTSLSIEAEYNGATMSRYVNKQFKTLSGNSLEVEQILLPGGQKPSPQSQIEFRVRATEDISVIFYQILSKSSIVASGTQGSQIPSKSLSIRIPASIAMSPSSTIVVYYVNAQSELIAAAQRFEVTFALNNQVTITWDADRKKVNENALLTVRADPSSYVSVGAVDQSVLLLGESNDMTEERIIDEFSLYESRPIGPYPGPFFRGGRVRRSSFFWPWYSSSSDTTKVLRDSGLIFMTDALVFNEPQNDIFPGVMEDGIMFRENVPMLAGKGSSTPEVTQVYVRKFFPENWIWDSKTTGSNGFATFSVTVPDTLTKWVATAFALHPQSGLGIPAQRANLTAFQAFFMRVDKPYSVLRGEEVVVNVVVFNYLGGTRQATVELRQSAEFKVKENVNDVTAESKTLSKTVQIEDQKGASVSFIVVPEQLGYLTMNLRAVTAGVAGDALEETLLVEPEGRLVEQNKAVFVSLESSTNTFSTTETVTFPLTDVVPGSRAIVITVIGDLLGTTLSGLGHLIRMPYGCGEQNMISFVPNIVVRKYLESSQTITVKQRTDTTRFMEAGYQRELTYQRTEGSFSAFGDSDKFGSTWLTAFVVQSFKQAQPYIFVDDALLAKSLTWLIANTFDRRTDTFTEVGNVIHDAMQGGQQKTMTAYVLIALEFCSDLNQTVDNYLDTISRARQTVENTIDATDDPYTLAIIAYALQLSNSPSVPRILNKLDGTALLEQGMKYWKLTTGTESKPSMCYRCHRQNNQVELASFVLLTHVLRGELTAGLPIARYLMSAKNPSGGFYSTQDTVWGLTALAEFSAASRGGAQQYVATITVGAGQSKQFNVNPQNAQVLQRYELMDNEISGNAVDVKVDVTGSGTGLVEISSQYYTTQQEDSSKLKLTVQIKERNSNVREVTGCVNVMDNNLKDMIVMEISEQSGFPLDASSIPVRDNIKRVEKEGKKVSVYYDTIPAGQDQCVKMLAYKENDVVNVQAATARAFGYYSGEETVVSYLQQSQPSVEVTTRTATKPTSVATKSSGSILTSLLLLSAVIWLFHQA